MCSSKTGNWLIPNRQKGLLKSRAVWLWGSQHKELNLMCYLGAWLEWNNSRCFKNPWQMLYSYCRFSCDLASSRTTTSICCRLWCQVSSLSAYWAGLVISFPRAGAWVWLLCSKGHLFCSLSVCRHNHFTDLTSSERLIICTEQYRNTTTFQEWMKDESLCFPSSSFMGWACTCQQGSNELFN